MGDQPQDPNSPNHGSERTEPVRSRWTPKPEQILILESIFNSGMVNPPKEETVRIRKLLEKFGSVGDANVFYWFQNRRSRSRRRQRQMQASLCGEQAVGRPPLATGGGAIHYGEGGSYSSFVACSQSFAPPPPPPPSCFLGSSSSSSSGVTECVEELYSFSGQMGMPEMEQTSPVNSILCNPDASNSQFQNGFVTVFINGVATDVSRGPLDMKAMFGEDLVLLHSSGLPVPVNEYGFSVQSLQHGESYFLVSRPT